MRSPIAMIVLASFTLLLAACRADTTAPSSSVVAPAFGKGQADNTNKYDWVGKYHNDALDYAIAKVRANKKGSKLDRCKVGLRALKEFQNQYRKVNGSELKADPNLIDGMCEAAAANVLATSAPRSSLLETSNLIAGGAASSMNDISLA